jgi:hypothetical protein
MQLPVITKLCVQFRLMARFTQYNLSMSCDISVSFLQKKMTPNDRPITDILLKVGLSTHNPFMAGRGYVPIYYLDINFPFPLLVRQPYLIFS